MLEKNYIVVYNSICKFEFGRKIPCKKKSQTLCLYSDQMANLKAVGQKNLSSDLI